MTDLVDDWWVRGGRIWCGADGMVAIPYTAEQALKLASWLTEVADELLEDG